MFQLHQYQQRAEPLSQAPETVSVDRWYRPLERHVRRPPPRRAAESCAPVYVPAAVTVPDGWGANDSRPLRLRRNPACQPCEVLSTQPETIYAPAWQGSATRTPSRVRRAGCSDQVGPLERYDLPPDLPLARPRPLQRVVRGDPAAPIYVAEPSPTVEAWSTNPVRQPPRRSINRGEPVGPVSVSPLAPAPPLESWQGTAVVPRRLRRSPTSSIECSPIYVAAAASSAAASVATFGLHLANVVRITLDVADAAEVVLVLRDTARGTIDL